MNSAQQKYVERHSDRLPIFRKRYSNKMRRLWGDGLGERAGSAETEKLGLEILTNLGFTELVWIAKDNRYFPFDILGRDAADTLCLFEVTTALHRDVETRLTLKNSLRALFYALFITPRMDKYVLKQVNGKSIFLSLKDVKNAVKVSQRLVVAIRNSENHRLRE